MDVAPVLEPGTPGAGRGLDARSLIRSAWWMSGSHLIAQLCAYAALLVVARLVPPSSFGQVAAGTAILYIAILFMDSGTQGSIVVRRDLTPASLRRALLRCVGMGLAISGILALLAGPLTRAFAGGGSSAVLAVLGLGVPLYALAVVPMALLQRSLEFRHLGRAWAVANVVSGVAAVAAAALGAGVWALVVRQLAWCAGLALLASLFAYRHARPGADARGAVTAASPVARWFLFFGVTQVATLNLDYFVVGHSQTVAELGLYSLAFTIAFAPVEHFSAHVGKVLFAAAAASDRAASGARTVAATRLMAILLLPLLPVMIVLAPWVLPAVLGSEWKGMVTPFQILVGAGVGYAIVNCIGEALSGGGRMEFRAKLNLAWGVAMFVALVVLVRADGIRGAAIAQLGVFVAYAAVYTTAGARRAGAEPRALWRALEPVLVVVVAQAAVTLAVMIALREAGASEGLVGALAAAAGLLTLAAVATRGAHAPLREAAVTLRTAARSAGS